MADQPIEATFYPILWRQFGAAIDMLENALLACPASLWREHLWNVPSDPSRSWNFPQEFSEVWYINYHALIWLDLYLSGLPEEQFVPPAPFAQGEIDSIEALPEQPYTKEELHAYLISLRQKCRTQLLTLTDERAHQAVVYPWLRGQHMSYLELQLYSLRHIQEHVAQLSLFLGQHGVPGEALDWVPWAKEQ